jgi:hypothetical protein
MKNYYSPTPKKWRKIGDSALIFSMAVAGYVTQLPITDAQKMWAIFVINLVGVFGKIITNFVSEETPENKA